MQYFSFCCSSVACAVPEWPTQGTSPHDNTEHKHTLSALKVITFSWAVLHHLWSQAVGPLRAGNESQSAIGTLYPEDSLPWYSVFPPALIVLLPPPLCSVPEPGPGVWYWYPVWGWTFIGHFLSAPWPVRSLYNNSCNCKRKPLPLKLTERWAIWQMTVVASPLDQWLPHPWAFNWFTVPEINSLLMCPLETIAVSAEEMVL